MKIAAGIVFLFFTSVLASPGDNHYVYQSCLQHCQQINCTTEFSLSEFYQEQPFFESLLQWTCSDECSYRCMWQTVDVLQRKRQSIVQFHGKWPFQRVLGIQEPASVLFSLMNLLSNYLFGILRMRRELKVGVHPLAHVWYFFCFVSMNAWFWSTIFHSRDKPLTEAFDYIGAISLVFCQFACCIVRVFYRTKLQRQSIFLIGLIGIFFLYHAQYLLFVRMDFGYNMKVNISVGLVNVLCWLAWSIKTFLDGRIYVFRCALSVVLTLVFAAFELADFPPIFWLIDAHALWHLSTVFLPILWYRFVIDDSKYLLQFRR